MTFAGEAKQSHQYLLLLMVLLRSISHMFDISLAKIMFFILISTVISYSQSDHNIELVESIPLETTLDNPDIRNTQEVWLEMINSAQKTIDIEQFYISNEKGEALDTVLNAIVAAANRGVIVRIIVDAGMYQTYPDDVNRLEKLCPNITKRVIDFKQISGGIQHAKFFIIDGYDIFLGSQNFDWRALSHIHELGIRQKDMFSLYKNVFEYDWCMANNNNGNCIFTAPMIELKYSVDTISFESLYILPTFSSFSSIVKFNISSGKDDDPKEHINWLQDLNNINKIIFDAKQEITLQFLSYNPITKDGYWEEVDTALISATKRGVKVKLIVSDWNLGKTAVEHFKELIRYPGFEIKYTAIPDYSGGFIPYARVEHCKYITADDYTWIGTSNMSYDYFYESRNVGVVIENGKYTQRVRDIFYKSWNSDYAHPIELTGEYTPRKRN